MLECGSYSQAYGTQHLVQLRQSKFYNIHFDSKLSVYKYKTSTKLHIFF